MSHSSKKLTLWRIGPEVQHSRYDFNKISEINSFLKKKMPFTTCKFCSFSFPMWLSSQSFYFLEVRHLIIFIRSKRSAALLFTNYYSHSPYPLKFQLFISHNASLDLSLLIISFASTGTLSEKTESFFPVIWTVTFRRFLEDSAFFFFHLRETYQNL